MRGKSVPLHGIKDKYTAPIYHVPLVPRKIVQRAWDESRLGNMERFKHRSLPETAAAIHRGEDEYNAQSQDAFDRARDET